MFNKVTFSIIVLLLAVSSVRAATESVSISNSGFESSLSIGWNQVRVSSPGVDWLQDSAQKRSGTYSAKITGTGTANGANTWMYQAVSLTKDRVYTVSLWYRTDQTVTSNAYRLVVGIGTSAPSASDTWTNSTEVYTHYNSGITTWTEAKGYFVATATGTYYLGIRGAYGGVQTRTQYIDDLSLSASFFYTKQSGLLHSTANWQSERSSGSSPANFTSPGINYVVQNNHAMTTNSDFSSIASKSSAIVVESGGSITATNSIDLTGNFLVIQNGGSVVINNPLTVNAAVPAIFSGTELFEQASNFEIRGWNRSGTTWAVLPSVSWGNLSFTHDIDDGGAAWNFAGNLTEVKGNLTFNADNTTRDFRLTGNTNYTLNIGGNLVVQSGVIDFASGSGANTINLKGNFIQSGGSVKKSSTGTNSFNFSGTSPQTFTKSAGTIANAINFTVNDGSTIDFGTSVLDGSSGSFTLSSGATLITANTAGITSSGASGSVQVTGTRTYNTGANYTYKGSSPQASGNGLPTTVNNLTINNSAGVTLSGGVTANGNLTLVSGVIDFNSNTLTVNGTTSVTGGSFAEGSTPATDGYSNASVYLSIATNNQNITGFSASTAVVEDNFPERVKRQWTINGIQTNDKSITFSWTSDDDNNFNWDGKVASMFRGSNEYAGDAEGNSFLVDGNSRSLTILAPISTSKDIWNAGLKGGEQTLPIELSSFTASISAWGSVQLTWVTQSETNVLGFKVLRSYSNDLSTTQIVSPLIPATNTSNMQLYVFQDTEPGLEGHLYYWLNHFELGGSESFHGPITIEYNNNYSGSPEIPLKTRFDALYPNPFNPSVNIAYQLAIPAEVIVNVYNYRGQLVKNFSIGRKETGYHDLIWNGLDNNNLSCCSGLYLFEMIIGKDRFMKKAALLK